MTKEEAYELMDKSRYVETSDDFENFELAVDTIAGFGDYKDILLLTRGFEDGADNIHAMYHLTHTIERYISSCGEENYVLTLFQSLEESAIYGRDWMMQMIRRILNSGSCLSHACNVVDRVDEECRRELYNILEDIAHDNEEQFGNSAGMLIAALDNL